MRRSGGERRPIVFHQDAFVVEGILGKELTVTRLELSDLRRGDESILAVGPVEAPLVGLGIVEPQRETLGAPRGTLHVERVELSAAVPERRAVAIPREIDPLSRACE